MMNLNLYIKTIIFCLVLTSCQGQDKQNVEQLLNECWTSKYENFDDEILAYKNWLVSQKLINTSSAKTFKKTFINLLIRKDRTAVDPLLSFPYELSNQVSYDSIFKNCLAENLDKTPSSFYGKSLLLPEKELLKMDLEVDPLKFIENYYSSFGLKEYKSDIVQKFLLGKLKFVSYQLFLKKVYSIKIKIETPNKIIIEGKVVEMNEVLTEIERVVQGRIKKHKNFDKKELTAEMRIQSEVKMGVVIDVKNIIKEFDIKKVSYTSED